MSNWANRTKENLQAVVVESLPESGELIQVGGNFEPISCFYRFNAPKKEPKSPYKLLESGQVITGIYEGSFEDKLYKKPTHKVRTEGGLIGLPSSGSIDKAIAKVAEGATVRITYNGQAMIKTGQFAGRPSHSFTVAASRLKTA